MRLASTLTILALAVAPAAAQADAQQCDEPLSPAQLRAELAEVPAQIMGFEATEAAEALRLLARNLPCLTGPIEAEELARLWYLRGLARLYATEEGKTGGEDAVQTFFGIAHRVEPGMAWDGRMFGALGEDAWRLAVSQRDAAVDAADRGTLPDFWILTEPIPGGLDEVRVDGRIVKRGESMRLSEGAYLLQYQLDGQWAGAWVDVDDPSRRFPLPLPESPAAGDAAPPAAPPAATSQRPDPPAATADDDEIRRLQPPEPESPADAAPPSAPDPQPVAGADDVRPPPEDPRPRLSLTLLGQTWRIPQLYSGPELGFQVAIGRLRIGGAVGAGAGPWKSCAGCVPTAETLALIPVRGEVGVALGQEAPATLILSGTWQALFGGGFGILGEELAPSAHGLEGTATLALGPGALRLALRVSGGWMFVPAAISGPQVAVGAGLMTDLGRLRR